MVANKIQFAVVREDPVIEIEIVRKLPEATKVALIGSGGCTAFALRKEFPKLEISILEPNPNQVELIRQKLTVLKQESADTILNAFGVGREEVNSFTACGNFESLFRGFRNFIWEFVCEEKKWKNFFNGEEIDFKGEVFNSKYWPVSFDLFFSNSLINAMFGTDATQHAIPGSYPSYFRRVLEDGLMWKSAPDNYFIQHIFLGYYLNRAHSLPVYLTDFPKDARDFEFMETVAQSAPDYGGFDCVSLSNIFDWMNETEIKKIAERLCREMREGSIFVFRQLNNPKNLEVFFKDKFKFLEDRALALHAIDRSLFYDGLHIGQKVRR